jgi:hypothetical protein
LCSRNTSPERDCYDGCHHAGTGGSIHVDPAVMIELLRRWLSRCVVPDAMNWLEAEIDG